MTFSLHQFPARRRLLGSTILVGAMSAAFMPASAIAQDATGDATQLAPIVLQSGATKISEDNNTVVPKRTVSATKTDTPIVETPRAISVVTHEEMEQRAVTDMIQAARYSSGVTTGAFGYDPRFDQIYIRGIETTTTGDFRDSLRQPIMNYGSFATEVYTLDRIEILKGPVSVMYGAASAAGIVNRISKMPQEEAHHEVELQYGTVGRKQAAFDFGGPVGESDELFYRLVGLAREGEGSYDIPDDRYLLQPSFTWKPSDDTTVTVYGLAQKGETGASAWSYLQGKDVVLYTDPDFNSQKVEQYQLGYQLEHKFDNGLTFRQNARVGDVDLKAHYLNRVYLNTAGNWPTTAVTEDMRAYQIDNQLESQFDTGSLSHTLLVGLDYTRVLSEFAMGDDEVVPGTPGSTVAIPALTDFTDSSLSQTGIYAQDQIEFGRWRAVAGLRYDWAHQKTAVEGGSTSEKDDGVLSGQVGLLYLFDNGLAPYISYGTSFIPSTALAADGSVLEPTKGRQIEVGLKYQPQGENYSLSGAVYRLVETGKPQYDVPSYLFSHNSGENTYTGFEIEGRTEFDNGISLIAAYTYAHAEITENFDPSLVGNTPSTVPRHVASLWVNYAVPEDAALSGLSIGGGVRVMSDSFTSDANTSKNAGVGYLDAALSYDFGATAPDLKGLSLAVSATNLADRREQVCTDGYCYTGRGRTVLGSLKYKW